jgi:PAS domain S-box-containing protein
MGIALPMVTKPFVGQSAPYVSFIPAVLLSAWYGGFVPGLLTTGLLLAAAVALRGVVFTGNSTTGARIFGAVMFAIAALAVCWVIRALRLAQAAALEAAAEARAAEARAQSERDRLDVILRDLPVGVVIATGDRDVEASPAAPARVELANPAAMEIFGVRIKPGDAQASVRPPSFRNAAGEALGSGDWPIERSQRGETVVNEEIDIVRPDGFLRTLMVNARPVQGSAGQTSVLATYSDVTSLRAAQKALRASETRLRRLFDSPIIGVVSGNNDVALEANDGFLRMLGYSRADLEAGAIRFSKVTAPEFQAVDVRIGQQLAERGFSDPVTKELVAADGRRIPVMVGATSFEAGQASPWISWALDLSEHRRLEERLRQAAKAESIGLLAGGVAHDFNNLLTIIMGNAALAHGMLPHGSPGRTHIENLLRAGERATDLTRQLLAYAGKGQFIVRSADVSSVIHDIAKLFLASAPKAVAIRLDLRRGLPAVNVDTTQIQQLVMNLVLNAIESIGDREGSVSVATSRIEVDGQFSQSAGVVSEMATGTYVRIEVSDDGCGMDMETRQRIFDPFFTTKFTGRGLGLAAAAGIVQAHRGGMIVRSTPDEGSVFQVFLPTLTPLSATPPPGANGVEGVQDVSPEISHALAAPPR